MIFFALVYGLITFFCMLGLESGPNELLFVLLAGVLVSTPFLTGMWAVFGQGSYLKRLLLSHAVAMIVGVGALTAMAIVISSDGFFELEELLVPISFVPLISIGAQLPFWFFRGCFGWQLLNSGDEPEVAFKIRDLFVLMFVFAIAISLPQIALSSQPFYDIDYSFEIESGEMTEEEAERNMRDQRMMTQRTNAVALAITPAYSFVVNLLAFPFVLFGFRTKEVDEGCLFNFLYACAFFGATAVLIGLLSQGQAPGEVFGYMLLTFAAITAAIGIPIAVTRSNGFKLVSLRKYRKENPIVPAKPSKEKVKMEKPKKHALDD